MSKEKTVKVVISHPRYSMRGANGKLQHMPPGTELSLSESAAKRLIEKRKAVKPSEYKRLVETKAGLVDEKDTASIEAINQLSTQVVELQDENEKLKAELAGK